LFPDTHKQAINGAMLFDTNALKPLFVLKTGKPGSSFTYEIARQIGFPENIIEYAIQMTGTAQIDYEKKIEEIEIEKVEIDKMLKMVHHADDQLAVLIKEYEEKFNSLEKQRKEILQTAKNQAIAIIDSANKIIEKTIREIRETKAEPMKTKEIRKKTAEEKEKIKNEPLPENPYNIQKPVERKRINQKKETATEVGILKAGDKVLMPETQTMGEVLQVNGQNIVVGFNSISLRTTIDKVMKISKKESKMSFRTAARIDGTSVSELMNRKIANFKHTLDLRGRRSDEALKELETYIDEALTLGIRQVKILHGKGDGILRHVLRQALQKRKEVTHFEDEALEFGGAGITVVGLAG
jgi:DNA mismatch repair protein MutS2